MSDCIDKDTLYLPAKWSKRSPHGDVKVKHIELVNEVSKSTRKAIPNTLNISYGPRERQKYDIFGTDLPGGSPIFIYIHGGYWQTEQLSKDSYSFIANNLYKNNIKTIILGYDLCPKVTMIELVDEIGEGLKNCLDFANKHKTRSVYLAGHSAGGHLVASIFTNLIQTLDESSRQIIKAAFLLAGVYDLVPIIETVVNTPLKLDYDQAKRLSPMHQNIVKNKTKFYVIAAEHDSPPLIQQAKDFHKKLQENGIQSVLEMLEGVDHFDMIENLDDEKYRLNQLIFKEIITDN